MIPNDDMIRAFANLLPSEAAYQESVRRVEADEAEESYYDEESDAGDDDDSDKEDEA